MSWKILFLIGTGSFIGGALRYVISTPFMHKYPHGFPWGTLLVNVAGCFCIGLLFGLTDHVSISKEWRLFLATGVLGGFTTFSAFSNETVTLMHNGQNILAGLYVATSILLGLGATVGGIYMGKLFA